MNLPYKVYYTIEAALTKFFVCTDRHISPFEGGQGGCYIGTIQEEGTISEGLAKKLSRPKNGLQLFCQFNLCFSFFKLSIVSKNSFTTSV